MSQVLDDLTLSNNFMGGHSVAFQDKSLTCADCGATFVFSAEEQEYFQSKGFENEPKRCPSCRRARKANRSNSGDRSFGAPREMFPAICAECGKECEVPFKPTEDRPVYCRECYNNVRVRR